MSRENQFQRAPRPRRLGDGCLGNRGYLSKRVRKAIVDADTPSSRVRPKSGDFDRRDLKTPISLRAQQSEHGANFQWGEDGEAGDGGDDG